MSRPKPTRVAVPIEEEEVEDSIPTVSSQSYFKDTFLFLSLILLLGLNFMVQPETLNIQQAGSHIGHKGQPECSQMCLIWNFNP